MSQDKDFDYTALIQQERPLFEANYVATGGDLNLVKWEELADGTGTYQPDWSKIAENDEGGSNDEITQHAENVQSCLMTWVECAKSKAIPEGYYLMPMQPSAEMVQAALVEFEDLDLDVDLDDLSDRIVFSHQAMIKVETDSKKS